MKKLYDKNTFTNNDSIRLMLLAVLILTSIFKSYGQLRVPFAPRTSVNSPEKTTYNVKGDFTMIGNTNLTLVRYFDTGSNSSNDNDMRYVDIDGTAVPGNNTFNSSSATLTFSNENGAIPDCSNIVYAGLYWTGRAFGNIQNDTDIFEVTKNGSTKTLDKRKILLKGPNDSDYTSITANNNEIHYPNNNQDRNIYAGYAEITDYVRANGIGEYFVADIATRESGYVDDTGFYGGWGMVVVYENSKMKWRDITVFDGYAFVDSQINPLFHNIPVSGFNAVQQGDVNLKIGMIAGEGEEFWDGDYFEISRQNTNTFQALSHSGNTTTNFFNSSIQTGGNDRKPNLQNNTGLDIVMFNINNTDNSIIANNQTSTTFRYGTRRDEDSYAIFNVTFAVDAYVPEPVGVLTNISINGNVPANQALEPNQFADYKIELKNSGTEAINNTILTVPIPNSVDPTNLSISIEGNPYYTPLSEDYTAPIYDPNLNAIVWNLGTLPVPEDPDTVLADISFKLTITTDCTILSSPDLNPILTMNGTISGTGATSNVPLPPINLIQGYESNGLCIGEPIPAPHIINIDYQDYINQAPTASNPEPINVECLGDVPVPNVNVITDAADNSGIAPTVTFVSDVSDNGNNPEIITRTYRVTDDCDNSINVVQIITVQDNTSPVIPILPDLTGECSVTAIAPTTTDVCAGTITGTTTDALTYSTQGEFVINWTFDDGNGNRILVPQNVIILDNIAPTITCPIDVSIDVDAGSCTASGVILGTPTTNDNCVVASVNNDAPAVFPIGNTTVIWTVTDGAGNTATCEQTVIVTDSETPVFVEDLPTDITVQCDAIPTAEILTATDNCGIPNITTKEDMISNGCNYQLIREWVATDSSGNTTTHTQTITVVDTTAPTIVTPFEALMNVSCADIPEIPNLEFTDNCSAVTVAFEETNSFNVNVLSDYQIVRTWSATDACDNSETFTQTIHVTLDEVIDQITAEDRCYDDGAVDLNSYLDGSNLNGTWELIQGDPTATLTNNIFDPTTLSPNSDFLPQDGGIDYIFRYTTTENGCINITELTMNINADCDVLPCGENDVVISKALTPNGDGINESFDILGIDLCGFEANVKIFNRWGALMFESDNYQVGEGNGAWTGRAKSSIGSAEIAPNGTYYYIVVLKNSGLKPFTGPIYLGTK